MFPMNQLFGPQVPLLSMDEPREPRWKPVRLPKEYFLVWMSKTEVHLAWWNNYSFLPLPVQVGIIIDPTPCHPAPSLSALIW